MGFFDFGKKVNNISNDFTLSDVPIFSTLSSSQLRAIEKKSRLIEFKRGDVVYEEAAPGDAFYVVMSGRFRLFNRKNDAEDNTLIFFYSGDHFGETSLLMNRPHSASVEAKSDGVILKIGKEEFLKLVEEIPSLSLHLSRSLGHRLTMSNGGSGPRREVKITSLFGLGVTHLEPRLWIDYAEHIRRESKREVILLNFLSPAEPDISEHFEGAKPVPYNLSTLETDHDKALQTGLLKHKSGFSLLNIVSDQNDESEEKKLSGLLSYLTFRYEYILVRLPGSPGHISFSSLKQSDYIYLFSSSSISDLSDCSMLIEEFVQSYGFSDREIKIVVTEEAQETLERTFQEKEIELGLQIISLLADPSNNAERYHENLRFLAKDLSGTLVGLALGSGAAYGLAHIGVIKVLEEAGIEVDVVSGSSIGAMVGSIWAAGNNAEELARFASRVDKKTAFFKIFGFRDVSIAHHGFFKGNKLKHFLAPYLKGKTFQDMRKQLRIVGTNLFTSEEVIFRTGLVTDAVRASVSIPGIFRPFKYHDQYLMDGGVIDPLPVRVLSQMGIKKIIAVNVLPSPKDWSQKAKVQIEKEREALEAAEDKGFLKRALIQLGFKLRRKYADNIFNVIMNSIQFMEFEMGQSWGKQADVLMHPIVHEGHWAQFYYPEKFIKAGEEIARKHLDEIKELVKE